MVLDDWENFLCYQDIEDIIAIRTSRINSSIAFKNEFNLLYIYIYILNYSNTYNYIYIFNVRTI
jgi:hypothetical protein